MAHPIRKAAVLGAGVMGSGIAAHFANAGVPVLLLDMVPPKVADGEKADSKSFRNKFALSAVANLKKQKPSPIFSEKALALIQIGNFDDDLPKVADCDWVVEVVKEDMAVKQALFAKLEPLVKPTTIVSSNTSGLSVHGMLEGRGENFKKQFLVTHFFNPVRYMKLLELVEGPSTSKEVVARLAQFGERVLGKGIVYAKDTTNFIANRIGTYAMLRSLELMRQDGMTVEEIDKIFGPAMGRPKSAVFRTADLVGLDTFMHVTKNCYDNLPNDESRATFKAPAYLEEMVKRNWLGDKTGQGFYKKNKGDDGAKEILALDLKTFEYKPQQKVRYDSLKDAKDIEDVKARVAHMLNAQDKAGQFAKKVTLDALAYASRRLGEIAEDYVNIDRAMRWGFAWDMGPFETWDAYGLEKGLKDMKAMGLKVGAWVEDLVSKGRKSFYEVDKANTTYFDVAKKASRPVPQDPRLITVEALRRTTKPVDHNDSATLWDMGEGILLCELHSKMNSIDDMNTAMLHKAVDIAEENYRGIVVGNDGQNFSAGANIMALLFAINSGEWEAIRKLVSTFQHANQRLRYSSVPVVTAPFQLVLGGGAELTMGGNAIQAAAETYMGLVEVGVGLIPGGSGNLQMLRNVFGPHAGNKDFDALPFLKKIFLTVGVAKVATSAEEAKELCFLSQSDGISMSKDHLLADARARCIGMAEAGFRPPRAATFYLPGKSGAATIDMLLYDMKLNHQISDHDRKIGQKLAQVLTGGDTTPSTLVSEEKLLELEIEAFLSLCGEPLTQARIMHMLEKGKPLRN